MTPHTIAKPTSVLAQHRTDKQIAEQATIHSFLNCYLRETNTGELITTTIKELDIVEVFSNTNTKSLICCQLKHQNLRLLIGLRYYSSTGRHLFAFPIYYQVDKGNLLELDYLTLATLITKELALASGSNSHQDELILRVIQSCNYIEKFIQQRRIDTEELYAFKSNFITAEQALVFGHHLHPTAKSRQGFADYELSTYSPELKGSFPLHYFRTHQSIVVEDSQLSQTATKLIKSELIADSHVDHDFKNTYCSEDEYSLLPIHPWQAKYLLQQPQIQQLIQQGMLQDLGLIGRAYQPTSSIRTVYHSEATFMLKLSLNVKITNSVRTNLYKELERSLEVHQILAGEIGQQLYQHFPNFQIITDPAYITLKIDGVPVDGFSTILRENPFLNNPQTDATCVVALCQDSILGNGSRLSQIIQELAQKENRSTAAVSLDWFNRYLEIYLEPILWLYFTYGIGLESHQQNSVVQLKDGYPDKFLYRDNQGYYYRRSCHELLDNILPGISQKSETICDDDVIDERLTYYLFFNNLFGLINAFGVAGLVDEELLLIELRNTLSKYSEHSLVKNLLSQPQLRCKANLLTRFHNMDELVGPVSTQSVYVAVDNPLYINAKGRGGSRKVTQRVDESYLRQKFMSVSTLSYSYERFDSAINKTIAFRRVVLEDDLHLIHNWMNQPHVIPFWNLAFDLERMREHLQRALADKHQTLYIGCLDNQPMSYWESYWTIDDIVARHYPAESTDQGIHLLIGEPAFLGKGYALPLLRAMTFFQFQNAATQKIIAEPDIRNKKMIHVFEKCGFKFQKEIDLPDKCGALMFCARQLFMQR